MISQAEQRQYIAEPHRFRQEQIELPNGLRYGDCEESWQRSLWERFDAKDGAGAPRYHVNYWELSRGHGKADMSAMAVLTAALLEDRLEVYFFAGDAEQAAIGLTMLTGMIQTNPGLASSFRLQKDRIIVPSTGTVIRVMSSDAATAFGIGGTARGILVVVDEFWVWQSQMLWEAIISSTGKVGMNWRVLILSNAGIDGESVVAWGVREACRTGEESGRYFWRSAGCIAGWIADEWEDQQRVLLTPGAYRRLIDNEWTGGDSQLVTAADWDVLVGDDMAPYPLDDERARVCVGIDASKGAKPGADTTAAVAVRHEGDAIRLVAHRIWKPTSEKGDLDLRATLLPWLLDLHRRYAVGRVLYDPYNMSTLAQMAVEAGLHMQELAQTQGNQTAFTGGLLDAIKARTLRVYPAPDLREHVLNAVLVETARGIRLAKDKASMKVDGAVALGMATWGVQHYLHRRGRESRILDLLGGRLVPDHQQKSLRAIYGDNVPDYAIDARPIGNPQLRKEI